MKMEQTYLSLGKIDVSKVADYLLNNLDDFKFDERRQKRFSVHLHTHTIFLRKGDLRSEIFEYEDRAFLNKYKYIFELIEKETDIGLDRIKNAIFVLMPPNTSIARHVDGCALLSGLIRTHVPIITNEQVIFEVDGESKHMKAGEIWSIDNLRIHGVQNNGNEGRIHLIFDYI